MTPIRLTPRRARQFLGITRRQLQYWHDTGLLDEPEGFWEIKHRRYSPRDMIILKAVTLLRAQGVPVQRIRGPIEQLRKILPQISNLELEVCCIVMGPAGPTIIETKPGVRFWYGATRCISVGAFARELYDFHRSI